MIKILYFASLRDRIGTDAEEIELPRDATIGQITKMLQAREGAWADAFGGNTRVLAAINQEMAQPDHSVKEGDEVAFFPPVTGG